MSAMEQLPDTWLKEEGQQQEEGGEEGEEAISLRLEGTLSIQIQEIYCTNPVEKFKNQMLELNSGV
jgi:hypothetical protein